MISNAFNQKNTTTQEVISTSSLAGNSRRSLENISPGDDSGLQVEISDNSCGGDTVDGELVNTTWIDGEGSSSLRNLEKNGLIGEVTEREVRPAEYSGTGVFDIYLEEGLFSDIEVALNTYVTDLTDEGYQVTVQEFSGDAPELRTQLQNRWQSNDLEGALFVGDLPYLEFTSEDNFGGSGYQVTYPHDLYFMDLDGNYNLNTVSLDQHTGDVGPEIYVSRLTTSNLSGLTGQDEATLINDYFARNHAYRTGELTFDNRGIVFADDDWSYWGSEQMQDLYSEVLAVNDLAETNKENYLNTLELNYESVLEAIHSSSTSHALKVDGGWEWISNAEILDTNPRPGFYNLFNCSSANFTVPNNLIGTYIYGGDYGLNAIGSTKTGSMLNFPDYYRPQGNGDSVGQAYLQWFDQYAASTDNPSLDWQVDWFYGMTMQGDPTLQPALMGDAPGEIQGTKWVDFNGDGIRQASEPGLSGWTIYLDQNQNNRLDDNELSTVTTDSGSYRFSDLTPGNYTVAEVQQSDWLQTEPTVFDYDWSDSDSTDLSFNWIDISGVGVELNLSDDDFAEVTLPFNFSFYGETQDTVNISSNGYLTFGDDAYQYGNDPIPESSQPNNMIAPFWDDLNPSQGGNIYHHYDAVNEQFIVQYEDVPHYYNEGSYSFEVILNSDGTVLYQYDDLDGTLNSATIGVENADGSDGVEIAFNESYVHDDLAILLEPVPNRPAPHTVSVGSGETVTDLDFGNQPLANLIIGTNRGEALIGTSDRDQIFGLGGRDTVDGGDDNDTIYGGAKNDTLIGGNGNDSLVGGHGLDSIDGGNGNDTIDGGNRIDTLIGGSGDDLLIGGNGDDIIDAGAGDDTIIGGDSRDRLTGSTGADTFLYNNIPEGRDTVTDFVATDDFIDVSSITISDLYQSDTPFDDYIELVQLGADTVVKIDPNGDIPNPQNSLLATLEDVIVGNISSDNFIFA